MANKVVTENDLLFTPVKQVPLIWRVTVGGMELATVEELDKKKYLVSISGRTDRLFEQRQWVMNYILNSLI